MENNLLFEKEEIITESDDKVILLTNRRIRYNSSSWGQAHIVSIMLEKISSIEIHYKSLWLFLVVGVILVTGGVIMGANNNGDAMILGLGAGAVLVLIYFFTRKHVVSISSDSGTKINFSTNGMKREKLMDFINKIERAKNDLKN